MVSLYCSDVKKNITEFVTTETIDFKKRVGKELYMELNKHLAGCNSCRETFQVTMEEWMVFNR